MAFSKTHSIDCGNYHPKGTSYLAIKTEGYGHHPAHIIKNDCSQLKNHKKFIFSNIQPAKGSFNDLYKQLYFIKRCL